MRSNRASIRAAIITAITILFSTVSFANRDGAMKYAPADDCIRLLETIYRNVNNPTAKGYSAKYSITTRSTINGKQRETTMNVDVAFTSKRLRLESHEMELYQDGELSVLVLPQSRTIYLTPLDAKAREQRSSMLAGLNEAMLKGSDVVECADVREKGADRRIRLRAGESTRRLLRINTISYLVSSSAGRIRELAIQYLPGGQVDEVRMVFTSMTEGVDQAAFDRPLLSNIYSAGGDLLPRLKGFRVMDLRGKGRKR